MQVALPVRERGSCCEVSIDLTPARVDAAVDVLRAMADPARLRILAALRDADQPICVCDFTAALGLSQPTISHHMGRLRDAGLVRVTRKGVWAFYELHPDLPTGTRSMLAGAVDLGGRSAG
ncbi:MAG: hypothetical protein QOE92_99 [Chloroflexota bacterium]|jgi:ArsR family transcriptional regulator|nr:hypothetical protein [Chloroflexota bacterium]